MTWKKKIRPSHNEGALEERLISVKYGSRVIERNIYVVGLHGGVRWTQEKNVG